MDNKVNEAALTKRVKTLVLQGRFEDALQAFEGVDIHRIRNNSILCLVGETYMGLGRYDEAETVLLRVYEKQSNTRRILDLLTTLYTDMGEFSEAEFYYKEFISIASKDLHRYILRYRLDKAKGERLSVLIGTLEKLKEYEYIEEWAYELASLYEQSGQTQKCIHECDEIVLWFGHGEYVDKAIALKCRLTGQPLPAVSTVEMYEESHPDEEEGYSLPPENEEPAEAENEEITEEPEEAEKPDQTEEAEPEESADAEAAAAADQEAEKAAESDQAAEAAAKAETVEAETAEADQAAEPEETADAEMAAEADQTAEQLRQQKLRSRKRLSLR